MNSEDDVVCAFTDHLRACGCIVLAEGGNQAAAFRYAVGDVSKAPDVVALCGQNLIVAEGKLRARDLFQQGARGLSDMDACVAIDTSDAIQASLRAEAFRRCRVSDIQSPNELIVKSALFAHRVDRSDVQFAMDAGVALAEVTAETTIWPDMP